MKNNVSKLMIQKNVNGILLKLNVKIVHVQMHYKH